MSGKNALTDFARLIADFEASDLREVQLRQGGFELFLSKDSSAGGLGGTASAPRGAAPVVSAPAAAPAPAAQASSAPATPAVSGPADIPEGGVLVRAPYLGTFYRAAKPGAAPYVEQGQAVDEDTEVCLVEVMKLFTAVRAGAKGTIHSILVEDGDMVAADQPLFVVMPA
ncbi:MAG: acetyl-CoA carboxylase biotin carboxyl carrier protein [Novosphingobium sp.]|nr:acetyl-CoA carboxylase biotin carboxyl carrier protein [Novosphingobium sp.]